MTHQQQQQQQQQHHHQQQSDGQKLEQCQPGEDTSICIVELDQHNNDKHNVNTERQPELKGGTFEFDMKQHMHLTKDQKYDLFREGLKRFVHEQEVKHGTVFAGPYTYKDCSCIHPGVGCLPFSLMHTIKVLPTSMSMYVPIHLVPVLIFKRKQILRQPFTVAWKFSKNVLRSALFTGFFQFGLVGSLCAFNRLFQYMGKWSVFLSGFVGGAAVFFEPFGRRLEMALFFVPKVGECIINTSLEHKIISRRFVRHMLVLTFSCAMAVLMYFFSTSPMVIKPSIRSLIKLIVGTN